jgi:hypothetical protein
MKELSIYKYNKNTPVKLRGVPVTIKDRCLSSKSGVMYLIKGQFDELPSWVLQSALKLAVLVVLMTVSLQGFGQMSSRRAARCEIAVETLKASMQVNEPVRVVQFKSVRGHKINRTHSIDAFVTYDSTGFTINISPLIKDEDLMTIIAHEFIHVWQISQGRLKTFRNGWVFNGVFYDLKTPIEKRPHEQEAFLLESNKYFYTRLK